MESISTDVDVIFGGISYHESLDDMDHSLRWRYGHKRETKSVEQRKKDIYRSIILGCFAIRKSLFIKISESINYNRYGLDILFTFLLKKESFLSNSSSVNQTAIIQADQVHAHPNESKKIIVSKSS